MTETHQEWWEEQSYLKGKPIGGGLWVCLAPMMFTWRLMLCDPRPDGVHEFYCYPKERGLEPALAAFDAWNGVGYPLDGWVKHHPGDERRP